MDSILGFFAGRGMQLAAMAGVALLIAAVVVIMGSGNMVSDLTFIMTQSRAQLAQGNNGYANFTNANASGLIGAGVFPSTWNKSGTLYDRWGNAVTLASTANGVQGQVTFGGGGTETTSSCSSVASNLNGYSSLQIGGKTFTPSSMPDAATAGTACAGQPTLTLTFQ
ncbi:hypothetical protein LMG22037_05550 [Paraburkholderia phenoliruptrix]|jgi:hypothetical protein|uniref:Type 4 secretion system PilS N-terminal domain-containing protein n=2 Tax=Paraburkholderia phenoliruptrix TaxID=252970 RepID=A0A6J5CB80_9BURK|nr:type 4 pilus major pilin [Paraburkholderia phenoliruptrix]CAB3730623.1 hypothetical protein LMG22037_05550 [Paraburkholderia phenoliruptrix]